MVYSTGLVGLSIGEVRVVSRKKKRDVERKGIGVVGFETFYFR